MSLRPNEVPLRQAPDEPPLFSTSRCLSQFSKQFRLPLTETAAITSETVGCMIFTTSSTYMTMTPTAHETSQAHLYPRSTRKALSAKRQPAHHAFAIPRYQVMLVKESSAHPSPVKIMDSQTAYRLLKPLFDGLDREHFFVAGLDAQHAVIGINTVSIGSVTLSIVHPREVFKSLILMNASAALLAHNHPSGDPTPSQEDRALTRRLKDGGELLGITVLDHLVLGEDRYYSFADHQEL